MNDKHGESPKGKRPVKKEYRILERRVILPPTPFKDKHELRNWWHQTLGNYGRYSCCAFFLVLPSDRETIRYFREYGDELDQISGNNCLVITLSPVQVKGPGIDWSDAVTEHVRKGYSVKIAEYFEIDFEQIPCLVVFKDIRSTEHIVLSLKGLDTSQIAEKMRQIFSTIQRAVTQKQEPLKELNNYLKKAAGAEAVQKIRSFAEKTYEIAVTAFVVGSTSGPQ